jgi:hypothetical protein
VGPSAPWMSTGPSPELGRHRGHGLQTYAGVVASLLGAAAKAQVKGALGQPAPARPELPGRDRAGKGALMERERLDEQEAFTHLRRAARSSGRKLIEVAREVAAGRFLHRMRLSG